MFVTLDFRGWMIMASLICLMYRNYSGYLVQGSRLFRLGRVHAITGSRSISPPDIGQSPSVFNTAKKALWGMATEPIIFIRFFPFFCFSRSFRLREMSPP